MRGVSGKDILRDGEGWGGGGGGEEEVRTGHVSRWEKLKPKGSREERGPKHCRLVTEDYNCA